MQETYCPISQEVKAIRHWNLVISGPILESKGMCVIFQKKGKKKAKYLKVWAKMYKIWNYFEKGQAIACNYCMQQTAGKGPTVNRYHEKHLSWDNSDSQKNRIDQVLLWLTGHFDFFNLE